ncbi:MAG: hypothetical protein ACI9HY_003679 [Planctomycetaceae bacterium]|jgi:hypothetical protein
MKIRVGYPAVLMQAGIDLVDDVLLEFIVSEYDCLELV